MKYRYLVCASVLALGLTGTGLAQDWDAPAAYGTASLSAGFSDDPRTIDIQAGGAIDASMLSYDCFGYITHQPSYSLNYDAGGWPLFISAASDLDGVLVVRGPDGNFYCNDDAYLDDGSASHMGLNPGVLFETPMSGEYDIWVGALGYGGGYQPGQLHISEVGFFNTNRFSRPPNPDLPPQAGTHNLRAGFDDDPRRFNVTAGGDVDLGRTVADMCWGHVRQAPSAVINYDADDVFDLFFSYEADADTTLAVLGPDGSWHCDDDTAGNLNPGVHINNPQTGRYAVWAGRYSNGPAIDGELFVSELGFLGDTDGPAQLDYSLAPNYGTTTLTAGFAPDPHSVNVMAGGDEDIYEAIGDVAGGYCPGYASRAPDYDLNYEAGSYDLYISAVTQGDATLVVNSPDGTWWCDDDTAGDLNPGLRFDAPESGLYNIWVGTYSDIAPIEGTLHISEVGFGDALGNVDVLDYSLDSNYGSVELANGFLPDPHSVEIMAGGNLAAEYSADSMCRGYVTAAPDYELTFDAQHGPLYIFAESDADTTIVINTPSGEWVCNDDQVGLNPGVMFDVPESGVYDIWVGTYWEGEVEPAILQISEIGFGDEEY